MILEEARKKVDALLARRRLAQEDLEEAEHERTKHEQDVAATTKAQQVVQQLAQEVQQRVHRKVAEVVTRSLASVFDDPYTFEIRFDRKRGKTEATMVLARDGVELDDPLNEVGGGVVDVAAFALRLACLMLARPKRRKLLVLDEPFRFLRGIENRSRVRGMIHQLSDELGVQMLINTDLPEFQMGSRVEME